MPQFGYTVLVDLEPRPGNTYGTRFYRQNAAERRRTQKHIDDLIVGWGTQALADDQIFHELVREQQNFPKDKNQGGGYYSYFEILALMHDQMRIGHDIPSGMLGRWNRMTKGTKWTIDMVHELQLPPKNQYLNMFEVDPVQKKVTA